MARKQFPKLLASCLAAIVASAGALNVRSDVPYAVSWVGNTWENAAVTNPSHVQYQINAIFVGQDGSVYADGLYDEGGNPACIYNAGPDNKGNKVANCATAAGHGRGGGKAVTSDGTFLYVAMSQGQDGTGTPNPHGNPSLPPSFTATAKEYGSGAMSIELNAFPAGLMVGDTVDGGVGIQDNTTITKITGTTLMLSWPTTAAGPANQAMKFYGVWYCVRKYQAAGSTAGAAVALPKSTTPPYYNNGFGFDSSMLVVSRITGVSGLAVYGSKLYVSDPGANQVDVYDTTSYNALTPIPLTAPGPITVDPSGNLWIIQNGTSVVEFSSAGVPQPHTIMSVANPVAVCYDGPGHRLLVADGGPNQQIQVFTSADLLAASPMPSGTPSGTPIGLQGGFNNGTRGLVADQKFDGLTGVGVDSTGNVYVSCSEFNNRGGDQLNGGAELKSFKPDGTTNWKLYGLQWENIADFSPNMSGLDIQATQGHYKMDYSQPAGQQWSFYGYSLDPFTYPNDARMHGGATTSMLRKVNGTKIQYGVTQGINGEIFIYRFQGEQAIPSGIIAPHPIKSRFRYEKTEQDLWPPNQPAVGAWIWRDNLPDVHGNVNGSMETDEYKANTPVMNDPTVGSSWVDHNGDIWSTFANTRQIIHYQCQGLDTYGNPMYDRAHSEVLPTPALIDADQSADTFTFLSRLQYIAESDTMYLAGFSHNHENLDSQGNPYHGTLLGKILVRYDHWSNTTLRTQRYVIVLPFDQSDSNSGNWIFTSSFTVVGEKVIAGDCKHATLDIYDAATGVYEQTLTHPGPSSQLDANVSLNSLQTDDAQCLVLANENTFGKNYLYQVGGQAFATYQATDQANTVVGGAARTSNSVDHLSNGGSLTFSKVNAPWDGSYQLTIDASNHDTANPRVLTVKVNGGTPTTITCPYTGSWDIYTPLYLQVPLQVGLNSVQCYGNGASAPDVRDIQVGGVIPVSYNAFDPNNTLVAGSAFGNSNPNSGYSAKYLSGDGYVIFHTVNVPEAGTYQLTIGAANKDTMQQTRVLSVSANEGGTISTAACPYNGSWTKFDPIYATVTLNAGPNTIKCFGNGVSAPDISTIQLGAQLVTTYNAYDSSVCVVGGGAQQGAGSVTFPNGAGTATFSKVNVSSAGSYQIRIDGANADTDPTKHRVLSIKVNGVLLDATFTCPKTGSANSFTPFWTTVPLHVGNNTIVLSGNGVSSPDVARLAVTPSQ